MKRGLLSICFQLLLAGALCAQSPLDLNEGCRLSQDPATGAFTFSWWGRSGRTYFIKHSEDMIHWNIVPIVEQGADAVIQWGFTSSGDKFFLKLKYTDAPTNDPLNSDSDGDGVSNIQELIQGTDPLSAQDTDGDGIANDWGMYYFGSTGLWKWWKPSSSYRADGITVLQSYQRGLCPYNLLKLWPVTRTCYADFSTATVFKDGCYSQQEYTSYMDYFWGDPATLSGPVTRTSSDPSLIAPSPYDARKWLCYGTGTATLTLSSSSQTMSTVVETGTWADYIKTFTGFAGGSAAENARQAIDSRIAGKNPADSLNLFSTRDDQNGVYVWNANCWAADLDLTCFSPWNSRNGNWFAGTLISPRHIIYANHATELLGATLRFVTRDNVVITRSVIASGSCASDIQIGILDSDVPSTITFAKVLPANSSSQLPMRSLQEHDYDQWSLPLPVLATNQSKQALIHDFDYVDDETNRDSILWFFCPPQDSQRKLYYSPLKEGDSGSPTFLVINNQPVLVTCWRGLAWGPSYRIYYDQIEATMDQLSSRVPPPINYYHLTPVDLSMFPTY